MKICPTCNRTYADETLNFCLDDGATLSASYDPNATQGIPAPRSTNQAPTEVLYPSSKPSLQPTIRSPQPPPYSAKQPPQSQEKRSGRIRLIIGVAVLLGIILGVGITLSFLKSGKDNAAGDRSKSKISNNANTTSTPTSVIPTSTLTELPGERWQECENSGQDICGIWTRESKGRWRGQWDSVEANLTITINGKDVTVTRGDMTSSLEATYRGTLNADNTQIMGTVDWCCDGLGNRSGTWHAQLTKTQK